MKKNLLKRLACLLAVASLGSCNSNTDTDSRLFENVRPQDSGVGFVNELVETVDHNYYRYMYTYIGAGVAAADFDKDGLDDLFFISNSKDNKLYLNTGDLKFKDISQQAGIIQQGGFDAGVAVADVNADGLPDIYITRGGWDDSDGKFANRLYINNGPSKASDGSPLVTFTEKAAEYGLDDANRGIQSTFFDYDRDGDLDLYIANAPDFVDKGTEVLDLEMIGQDPQTITRKGSDQLYQNDGQGHFTNVSVRAGILPDLGFGLNPQVGDLNQDGWLDVYVCNDFRVPDFAYLNNGDGTFREGRNELVRHMSFNSMGGDMADINNDGLLDLYTLDMNPEDYVRSKTTMGMTSPEMFDAMIRKNYHHQYMHNMLQINTGDGTFSEIANMAGVANTDWSWASLMADFDLDGYNDIYVTNGVFRDVIDRDMNNKILDLIKEKGHKPTPEEFLEYAKMLPQQKLGNYIYRNKGDLTFENMSAIWADSVGTFSNGAVYSDLDNDGDLDMVVSNINDPAMILKNTAADSKEKSFLHVKLLGPQGNPFGIGTVVTIFNTDGTIQTRQMISSRGFLSSMLGNLHFGLGASPAIDRIEVIWPDQKKQVLKRDIPVNQLLTLSYEQAETKGEEGDSGKALLFEMVNFPFKHEDPLYDDYRKQLLLPHKLSQTGPAAVTGDVNGDGFDDLYLGGGHTQAGQLLLGSATGEFQIANIPDFWADRAHEDTGACFFDFDGDGDLDLYVVSGSYEFDLHAPLLIDRLYLNDGKGHFSRSSGIVPEVPAAGSVVTAADYDGDGDLDLFVGGRVIPGSYPFAPASFLMKNEGGKLQIVTAQLAPELRTIGMVTDAAWLDIDQDQDLDLVVTGEWMGIEVFENTKGKLTPSKEYTSLRDAKGWWNKVIFADVDADGDIDIIAGNLGLNYKFHASEAKPFMVYAGDFDANGTTDVLLAKHYKGTEVPVRGKSCTAQQMPVLASKIHTYQDFASKDLEGLIGPELKNALHLNATEFRSGIFVNEGAGQYSFNAFENQAQVSPVNGILYEDFDRDGLKDLLLAGNNLMSEIETTRADAGNGVFMKGTAKGQFVAVKGSGFSAKADTRNLLMLQKPLPRVIIVNNNGEHAQFKLK
ncbi:VCBS repeat protein [Dyadobacter jejuensis]|uniref:VCBS repeat protein n=1 Tax=Dyadobacter jejuensis TaxID=1082580 RepID=A0A316AK88_9BACT|nr:CRTAC1 family protein [Dyadobacter jejuensis]PWJ58001.1 VCBS repeat protein [Dyadobacter jejuensis]